MAFVDIMTRKFLCLTVGYDRARHNSQSHSVLSNSRFKLSALSSELFLTSPATLGLTLNSEWALNWPLISPSTAEWVLRTAYANWGRGLDNFWLCPWIMIRKLPGWLKFSIFFFKFQMADFWQVLKTNSGRPLFFLFRQLLLNQQNPLILSPLFYIWNTLDHTRFH